MKKEDNYEKAYPVTTMAVQNRVTECFKSMSVDEKRILIMASPIARNIDATEQDQIIISAQQFADECGIKVNSAYKQIEKASKKLVDRSFSYINEKGKKVYSNWVIDATYEDAEILLRFTSIVLIMLKILDEYNPYTRYKKDVVLKLKKDYSIDFYHLAKKNQVKNCFELTLDEMFTEFGLPESYRDLRNLKKRVINPSLEEIISNTDIDLSYENVKKGRSVVGFRFIVKEKPQPKHAEPKQLERAYSLTEKQISFFANKLAYDDAFASQHAQIGEAYSDLEKRLIKKFADKDFVQEIFPDLQKLGFKLNK